MNASDLFASDPAPAAPSTSGGKVSADALFGGDTHAAQEPATSPLAKSRAALPVPATKDARASITAGAPNPPTVEDVQRNVADLHGGKKTPFEQATDPNSDEAKRAQNFAMGFALNDIAGPMAGIKGVINAVTNKSGGVSALAGSTTKLGDTVSKLSDGLYTLTKRAQGQQAQWLADVKNFLPKDWQDHAEQIYHSFEDPSIKLDPRAQELKDKTVAPIMAKNAKMREALKGYGVDVGPDVANYINRVPVGKSSLVDSLDASAVLGKAKNISTFTPETQTRKVFGMEGTSGEKNLHFVQGEKGSNYIVYRDGAVQGGGKLDKDMLANKEVTFMGEKYKLTDSTTKAIEEHTPLQYYKDPLLSAIQGNINLTSAVNNAHFLEQIKHAPEFKDLVVAPKNQAPEGFKQVSVPQLAGYKFTERAANVIEDFAGVKTDTGYQRLENISRAVVGSMFWNPLPHILNVMDHRVVEGGVTGALQAITHPVSRVADIIAAHKEVLTMGPEYRAAIKAGGGMMYPATQIKNFAESMQKELMNDPNMAPVAKSFGFGTPADMLKRVYQHANESLWSWGDAIMLDAYKAHMKGGMPLQSSIKEVEKHIPNYRLPDQILGSRGLKQVESVLPTFARYDYGRMASYGNMVKDLISKDSSVGDRAKALDQMAMLAVNSFIVYPALDKAVQGITGNPNASVRRYGSAAVPTAIYQYLSGNSDAAHTLSAMFPLSPVFAMPVAIYSNRDQYTGKPLGQNAKQFAGSLLDTLSPVKTAHEVVSGKKTLPQAALEQLGIMTPSQKQMDARAKAKAADAKRKAKADAE